MSDQPRGKLSGIPMPFSCVVDGRRWNLFEAYYTTPDGKYSFGFYAISAEHAEHILQDIKETAVVSGQVLEAYKENPDEDDD